MKTLNQITTYQAALFILVLFIGAIGFFQSACDDSSGSEDTLNIGLLLPYTGSASVYGSNFEKAVIMVVDELNRSGGLHGKKVKIVFGDSHTDPERCLTSLNHILSQDVQAIVGPENADVAKAILPVLQSQDVVFITPYIGASVDYPLTNTYPWFRLAPTASAMGEAIAKKLSGEQYTQVAFVHASDSYSRSFSEAAEDRFETLGGTVLTTVEIDDQSLDFGDAIDAIYAVPPQAIVLAAPPSLGASFVNDMSVAKPDDIRNWFFSPSLKTDVFLQNTNINEIEGGQGVAPQLFDHSQEFVDEYKRIWHGEEPLEGIYFYYDAIMMLAIALERVHVAAPGDLSYETLRDMVFQVANPSGIKTEWDDISNTMSLIRQGANVYYSGLTGPLLLFDDGERQLGAASEWIIVSGEIVNR